MKEKDFLDKVVLTYQTNLAGIQKWSIDSYIRVYIEGTFIKLFADF